MSDISNRAIFIAVSLLVTIAITSSIMVVMGYFRDVYKAVGTTDISLRKMFNEFDMYDNTVITGLDVLNLCNKYKNDNYVQVYFGTPDDGPRTRINKETANDDFLLSDYHIKYSCKCVRGDVTEIYVKKI